MIGRRILLCASDAGAAQHFIHLANLLRGEQDYVVTVCAGPVASKIFSRAGVEYILVGTGAAADIEGLTQACRDIVGEARPDLLIHGLSNAGTGPDEVLAATVRDRSPAADIATLLDDKGPLFTIDGQFADALLATSRPIETWARKTGHPDVRLIGSLKHHALSRLPADEIRADARAGMGIPDSVRLVTFIAQTDAMDGHNERFEDLLDVLVVERANLPEFELLVRLHPGAPDAGRTCYELALARGLSVRCDVDSDMTGILAASDALFSCSSTSMSDYVWLSLGGTRLNAVPVYLLGDALKKWLTEHQGTWRQELVEKGLALDCSGHEDMSELVRGAVSGELHAPAENREIIRDIPDPESETLRVVQDLIDRAASTLKPSSGQRGIA